MKITKETLVGELVAKDYRAASVFKEHGIDFCCNGNRNINEASAKRKVDTDSLIQKLEKALQESNNIAIDYNSWPIDLLADYIEKKHHRYVSEKILEIQPYLDKVCRVHGAEHPELLKINELFKESAGELTMHMKREELMLFPFIKKMVKVEQEKSTLQAPPFGTVQNPVKTMMYEHDTEGLRFQKISELSDNYTPPSDACNTYRVTFALLKEFEDDLHVHIHLENNLLFPKAIELENKLTLAHS